MTEPTGTPLLTTYAFQVQLKDGVWALDADRQYETAARASAAARKVYGDQVPTRVVTITRTVAGERQLTTDAELVGARQDALRQIRDIMAKRHDRPWLDGDGPLDRIARVLAALDALERAPAGSAHGAPDLRPTDE